MKYNPGTARASIVLLCRSRVSTPPSVGTVISVVGPVRHVAGRVVPDETAYHAAFLTAAAIALTGAVVCFLTVHDADAASTRTPKRRRPVPKESR